MAKEIKKKAKEVGNFVVELVKEINRRKEMGMTGNRVEVPREYCAYEYSDALFIAYQLETAGYFWAAGYCPDIDAWEAGEVISMYKNIDKYTMWVVNIKRVG